MAHLSTRIALTLVLLLCTGLVQLIDSPSSAGAASGQGGKPIQVDINSASLNELVALAGIREASAKRLSKAGRISERTT
jgi:DNA uptake protein ComE-like DNA-binding protein